MKPNRTNTNKVFKWQCPLCGLVLRNEIGFKTCRNSEACRRRTGMTLPEFSDLKRNLNKQACESAEEFRMAAALR